MSEYRGELIAVAHEQIQFTPVGVISTGLLTLHNIATLIWFGAVYSPEMVIGIYWIGGNVLLGLGIAFGRTRTYHVLRVSEKG